MSSAKSHDYNTPTSSKGLRSFFSDFKLPSALVPVDYDYLELIQLSRHEQDAEDGLDLNLR